MKRLSDEEILGRFVPRGLSPPVSEGEKIDCARLHCGGTEATPGARAHRWGPRQGYSQVIELCARCHRELATIISGG